MHRDRDRDMKEVSQSCGGGEFRWIIGGKPMVGMGYRRENNGGSSMVIWVDMFLLF